MKTGWWLHTPFINGTMNYVNYGVDFFHCRFQIRDAEKKGEMSLEQFAAFYEKVEAQTQWQICPFIFKTLGQKTYKDLILITAVGLLQLHPV